MKIPILNWEMRISLLGLGGYLLLLALLLSLGCWQLNRSVEKKQLLQAQELALVNAQVLNLNTLSTPDLSSARYQKSTVTGHYDEAHQFLLDNQILDGKPGYRVLTPFIIDQQPYAVLVNRGWLPVGKNRQQLPDLAINDPITAIAGRLNQFPAVGIKLAGAEIPTASWPAVVQVVDSKILAEKLGYPLVNMQIELDEEQAAGYKRQWQITTAISPEKHIAYAVQWFGLALTLTGLFLWISIRKQ